MGKIFVKKGELSLVNGGYMVTGKAQTPVSNWEFQDAQERAEWVVTFAEKAKGKDFVGKKADSLDAIKAEVKKALAVSKVKYVTAPIEVKGDITNKLHDEAMAFINFNKESSKADKINMFLQQFNTLQEFEEFGLYFNEGIYKLNRIYTIEEIVVAVKEVIDLLD